MAIGPNNKQPNFEVSKMDRIQNATKKIITAYFEDPLNYLFYVGLAGLMLSTAIRGRAPVQFWGIMGLLTAYKIYHYFYGPKEKTKE